MVYLQTDIKHLSMQQMEILCKLDNTSKTNSVTSSPNNESMILTGQ